MIEYFCLENGTGQPVYIAVESGFILEEFWQDLVQWHFRLYTKDIRLSDLLQKDSNIKVSYEMNSYEFAEVKAMAIGDINSNLQYDFFVL